MMSERLRIKLSKLADDYLGRLLISVLIRTGLLQPPSGGSAPVRKILFIKFWGLGSIVLSEPALRWLSQRYPQAEIHYLTLRRNLPLFPFMPSVHRTHTVVFDGVPSLLASALRVTRSLREERFQLVFDGEFFVNFSGLVAALSGGGQVIGFSRADGIKKEIQSLSIEFKDDLHTARQFLNLVQEKVDPSPPPPPRLILQGPRGITPTSDYLVLNVNASALAVERRWPRERFIQLARFLLDRFELRLVLIGTGSEVDYVQPVEKALPSPRLLNLAGRTDIGELVHLIAGARLIISNDSGPIHLASALDVPTVAFYGPETPEKYGPLSSRKLVFSRNLWCSPCMSVDNAKTVNCINHLACLEGIEIQQVLPAVEGFIQGLPGVRRRDKPAPSRPFAVGRKASG